MTPPLAVLLVVQIAYVLALVLGLLFGPSFVAELKGHDLLASSSWLTKGIGPVIGAFKLARPDSWWARHLYGPRKLLRAEDRYDENTFT